MYGNLFVNFLWVELKKRGGDVMWLNLSCDINL